MQLAQAASATPGSAKTFPVNVNNHKNGNKQLTAKLICDFVFAYAKHWFSHDMAHIYTLKNKFLEEYIL